MARKQEKDAAPTMRGPRVARLYKLLNFLAESPRSRAFLLKRLKINVRGFYRDLHSLRELGIEIDPTDESYTLRGTLSDALQRLPFPDPMLSFEEMLALAEGRGEASKKIRLRISCVTGSEWASRNGHGGR